MPEGARSDAPVTPKLNEGDIEDTTSAINAAPDSFWLASIEKDASALLDLVRESVDRGRILLVGYGFGGIVIKKAIFLANTNNEYNGIAVQVDRLVFFSTPHRDGEKKEWERLIKNIIQATDIQSSSRLPEIFFGLFRSSSQISQDFYKSAIKCPIANFIEKPDVSAAKQIMDEGKFADNMDGVESGPEKELQNFTLHEIATLDHLETLRTVFGLKQTCSNGLTSGQHDYGAICDYKYLLHRAALDNNLEAFTALRNLSENISEANDEGMTPLHMAAAGGSTSIISHLLGKCTIEHELINIKASSLLDEPDNKQRTPLIMAASMGHEEATKLLLQSGANISTQDDTGKTVLHYGALKYLIAVEDFISSDLLSVLDKDGRTALHIAASSGNSSLTSKTVDVLKKESRFEEAGKLEIVLYLLTERYVHPSIGWEGRLPICQAAVGGHLEIVRTLLRDEGTIKQADRDKKMALHHACDSGMHEVAELLLLNHANVEAKDWDGETPLHKAARKGRINVINLLLEFKANIHSRSSKEETPLHMAVTHPEAVKSLLKAGADPNPVNKERRTPLHCAVLQESWQSAVCLHQNAADPYKIDSEKQLPLSYAIAKDHLATVKEFVKDHEASLDLLAIMSEAIKYAAFTVFEYFMSLVHTTANNFHESQKARLLHEAAVGGSREILDLLLQSGIDANLRQNGSSALHLAAQNGYEEYVQKLINFGAKVDARDDENRTPLHLAAQQNEDETVKILLGAGSEINAQDDDSITPIYLASEFGAHRVLQVFFEYNPDMNIATLSQGWTPLHASIDGGHRRATRLLLGAGADPNMVAHDGWTPLHLAAFEKNAGAVKILLGHGADPTLTTNKGDTVLHLAVGQFGVGVIKELLEHGAEKYINDRGEANDTALHLALKSSDCNVELQLLIEHGADIDLRSSEELSTLMLATMARDVEKLNLLLSANITSRENPKWQLDDLIPAYKKATALYRQDVTGNPEKEDSKYRDIINALLDKEPKLQGMEWPRNQT
ncbi:ANK_REP_REGION domain-containing protein [Trichoderma simmonsii]|uniref:ANK_REP_REGION domain-containing protein n=1 Tax=Trichoderma simmonsii TaxID=1491479 RepID=A0A8G0LDQ1_9HYPO|nr:ANK_REP_REGION domain-containing protein [Trichoderma simmonsii]